MGGGVAGLAAAQALHQSGYDIVVLEARERLGGRVFTHRDPRVPFPIELGAEFIHGEAPRTRELLEEAGLLTVDVAGEQWRARRGRIRMADNWERIERVLKRIDAEAEDRAMSDFLADKGRRIPAGDRALVARFVQGFHAADLERVSTRWLAPRNGSPLDSVRCIGRVVSGYDAVVQWLARGLEAHIRLGEEVVELAWEKERVEIAVRNQEGRVSRVTARSAVITLPLGVLQHAIGTSEGLRIHPVPTLLRTALNGLVMGSAVRLVVWFSESPWTLPSQLPRGTDPGRLGFLHLDEGPFIAWWTAYPARCSVGTAWSGGPWSKKASTHSKGDVEGAALESLAEHLGMSRRRIAARVRQVWSHDWTADPFSRGAYSYARVNGAEIFKRLSRPVEGTLFLAGEATDPDESGTVEGALRSGERAAAQVKRTLS